MSQPYKRVLLKLSGESLAGNSNNCHDHEVIQKFCDRIAQLVKLNIELAVVVGGGNICRGDSLSKMGIDKTVGDYMGMLSTSINALAIQNILEKNGIDTRVMSAIPMQSVSEPYVRRKAIRHMEKGRVIICSCGTGNPFFTTDTAAVLRSIELSCDVMLKATQVDGVYDYDPNDKNHKGKPNVHYKNISYNDVLVNPNMQVLDSSAVSLARDNSLPIMIYSVQSDIMSVLNGNAKFSLISS